MLSRKMPAFFFIVLWFAAVQSFLWTRLPFTGDEPNYLLSSVSFVQDQDFNLLNNYREGDWSDFGYQGLQPQWQHRNPSIIPAEHGTMFPLFVTPAYLFGKVTGVRLFLLSFGIVGIILTYLIAQAVTGSTAAALLSSALLAFSPTWQMQSSRIYPETVAGCLLALGSWCLYLAAKHQHLKLPGFCGGFALVFLPALYLKFGAVAAPILLASLAVPRIRSSSWFWAGCFTAASLFVVNYALFRDDGALGGAFSAESYFQINGFLSRLGQNMFDQFHGAALFQPYVLLLFWSASHFALRWNDTPGRLLAGAALGVLGYLLLHGLWTSSPGWSVPGRYFTAILPLGAVLTAAWSLQPDRWQKLRVTTVLLCLGFELLYWADAWRRQLAPCFVMSEWRTLFPRFSPSWEVGESTGLAAETSLGLWLLFALVLTKAASQILSLRQAQTNPSP